MMAGRGSERVPATGSAGLSLRKADRKIRLRNSRGDDELLRKRSHGKGHQEKRRFGVLWVSVLKPTQVGEASSLRRSREPRKRNSAKWFRNLGIRIALQAKETCSLEKGGPQ